MKLTNTILISCLCASLSFGADFSKTSNDEIAKISGTLKPQDEADLKLEIRKRLQKMDATIQREFIDKITASYKKNTEKLNVKEFRKYEAEVKHALQTKMNTLGEDIAQEVEALRIGVQEGYESLSEEMKKKLGLNKTEHKDNTHEKGENKKQK